VSWTPARPSHHYQIAPDRDGVERGMVFIRKTSPQM
jgi:hypothetical protein